MWEESKDDAGKSVSFYKERKVLRKGWQPEEGLMFYEL